MEIHPIHKCTHDVSQQFDPELDFSACVDFCMFTPCPCGFPPGYSVSCKNMPVSACVYMVSCKGLVFYLVCARTIIAGVGSGFIMTHTRIKLSRMNVWKIFISVKVKKLRTLQKSEFSYDQLMQTLNSSVCLVMHVACLWSLCICIT